MATVTVEWEATEQSLPFGSTDDDHYLVSLDGSAHHEMVVPLDALSAEFDAVEPGTYRASVQNQALDDSNVGEPSLSEEFVVADTRVRVLMPGNVRGTPGA